MALSQSAKRDGDTLAHRLQAELIGLIRTSTDPEIGPRAASRLFNVDFGLCQRVLTVARSQSAGLELLARLPGPAGLRTVVEAIITGSGQSADRHPAIGAVEAFAEFVKFHGPSHAKLIDRINSSTITAGVSEEPHRIARKMLRARKGLFEHASSLTSGTSEWECNSLAIRPRSETPGTIEAVSSSGVQGIFSPTGRATVIRRCAYSKDNNNLAQERVTYEPLGIPTSDAASGLVEEFTTQPLPTCSVESQRGKLRMVLDLASAGGSGNVMFANRWNGGEDPRFNRSRKWTHSCGLQFPSRRFIVNLLMHRDLDPGTRVEGGAMWYRPGITSDLREEWERQVPGEIPIHRYDAWLKDGDCPGLPSALPMMRKLFELGGWDPEEFVLYRIDHEFPFWGAVYWMTFHFQGSLSEQDTSFSVDSERR